MTSKSDASESEMFKLMDRIEADLDLTDEWGETYHAKCDVLHLFMTRGCDVHRLAQALQSGVPDGEHVVLRHPGGVTIHVRGEESMIYKGMAYGPVHDEKEPEDDSSEVGC